MAAVSFEEIKSFNDSLKVALNNQPPFGLTSFPSLIKLIAKDPGAELGKVIRDSAGSVLAVFGLDSNNNFTISFLPLDSHDKIITSVDGEESWPVEHVTNFPEGLEIYLP